VGPRIRFDPLTGPLEPKEDEMAEEHPNVKTVKEGFDAFERGDMSWIDQHMADDVIWHVGGKSKMAGAYEGKEAVLTMWGQLAQLFAGAPAVETHEMLGNDDHVIVIGRATANDPDGGTVSWLYANVFHVADGKVKEVWGLADETSESDALINKLMD
jgi:uncharacterized protein